MCGTLWSNQPQETEKKIDRTPSYVLTRVLAVSSKTQTEQYHVELTKEADLEDQTEPLFPIETLACLTCRLWPDASRYKTEFRHFSFLRHIWYFTETNIWTGLSRFQFFF